VHKSLRFFRRNAKKRKCDKTSSKARELQQESSKKATFFLAAIAEKNSPNLRGAYLSICTALATKPLTIDCHVCQQSASQNRTLKCPPRLRPLRQTAGPFLALIGNLICVWSNNESLFIYVLMMFAHRRGFRRSRVRDIEHDLRETRSDPATGQHQD
jgi:hypothetical protein